jgi:hypothetical protein
MLPNLQQFNIGDALVLNSGTVAVTSIGWVVLSGLLYTTVYLLLGTLVFRRREI